MKQKLLLIASEFPPGPGGIGHHAYSLVRALSRNGWDITVISPADYADAQLVRSFDDQADFRIIRYPATAAIKYIARLLLVYRLIRQEKFTRIFLTGKFSLWVGLFIRIFFPDAETIAILHGSEINLQNRLLRWLTHRSIQSANSIVAVSAFTASLLPDWIRHKRVIDIIPNGIDFKLLSSLDSKRPVELKGWPRLLTIGHLSPRKGQHRVIRALPELKKKYPEIHYHMVGRPINRAELETLAYELGVTRHVSFHGVVAAHEDLASWYRAADIFMLLSENQPNGDVEGFGIVALEANVFGMPVIGAKYCGVEDAVDVAKSGFLVDGDDPMEITTAVEACIASMDELKKESVEWAKKHDWKLIVQDYKSYLG
jgi:phosphatidylinositol alpha-1,6-mannosyltransferase